MSAVNDLRSWATKQGAPVTIGLIASITLSALLFWFTRTKGIENFVLTQTSNSRPWSFFTYAWSQMPFASGLTLMFFVFLMMWLYSFGSTVERDMGSRRYAIFWAVAVIGIGLTMWAGMALLNAPALLADAYLPVSAMTMVWCARHPTQPVMIYGVVPLSGRWLAVVDGIVTVLLYGFGVPLLGVCALLPLVAAYFYGAGRLPAFSYERKKPEVQATRAQTRYGDKYFDEVKRREQERAERERLRRLFEGSLKDDE